MNFKRNTAELLSALTGIDVPTLLPLIEVPPKRDMGDFAFPCFSLAKTLRKAPPVIAQDIAGRFPLQDGIARVEAVSGYVNVFLDAEAVARETLRSVASAGSRYGASDEGQGRVVCMDYSSINIAKPFHIGHLSSTVIGHSLYRIYGFLGYKPIGINHLGDWGTQFGKLIVAFQRWGDKDAIEAGGIKELLTIYVRFHDEAEKDDALNDEARAAFKRIEDGDPEALTLFQWFKDITLRDVGKIYDVLGIVFDSYAGESFYNDKMDRVVDELEKSGLLVLDQGAWVVNFPEKDHMPPCLVRKADGASLYITRDIAAALYRKEHYDFYKSLYIVAYQQNLHFKQLFRVVGMMGYDWAKDMEHVAFGMVSIEEGTLSTRSGRVLFLQDVFEKATEKALELIEEKSPDLENKREVAAQIGVGALVYGTLSASRIKDINFSWDRTLNFEGETGPYCQYTHARACSVLRKAETLPAEVDYAELSDDYAQALIKLIAAFPEAVQRACAENEPFVVTRAVTEIAQAYNKFYFEQRILDAPPSTRAARLALTDAARQTIANGLYLIGIAAPERM